MRCTVTNNGRVAGDEVVQLYIRDVLASVARPVMELKGFSAFGSSRGSRAGHRFTLGPEHLRMLDRDMNAGSSNPEPSA